MSLAAHVAQLARSHELLWLWGLREIRVRYSQSVVGVGWALLQPVVLMLVFTLVFSRLTHVSTGGVPYPVFAYAGLVPWTFLASSLTFGVPSLVSNIGLVTKASFPKEILPMAQVVSALADCAVASLVFLGLLGMYGLRVHATVAWLPLLLAIQLALVLGVTLMLSAVNVRYRDIRFIVPLGIQVWMFASPVIYPATLVPAGWRAAYDLNPMVGLLEAYRMVLIAGRSPSFASLGTSAAVSLALLVIGYSYFKRRERDFADVI